jgi:replication factor C subunit 3/5
MNDFLPWVEKYRPKSIDDIISHDQNIKTIKKLLLNNALPHLLFHGSPGTGKTSTINTIAHEIYGDNIKFMIMKLDASDDRGINSVREDIKGFAEKSNMFYSGVKLIILDEADAMTFDAQFALRRIIEKYSSTIRFCLICNYENKIIPAIRARCANFRFSNINSNFIYNKLKLISDNEKLLYDVNALKTISILSNGDLRKAINTLQNISMQNSHITEEICYSVMGTITNSNLNYIIDILSDKKLNFIQVYNQINKIIKTNDYSLHNILKGLIPILINKNNIISIIAELSNLENIITSSTFDDIYISLLVSIFRNNLSNM